MNNNSVNQHSFHPYPTQYYESDGDEDNEDNNNVDDNDNNNNNNENEEGDQAPNEDENDSNPNANNESNYPNAIHPNDTNDNDNDANDDPNSDKDSHLSDKEQPSSTSTKTTASTAGNQELWKVFGRETDAGKLLFSLYRSGKPAQINYPKPKTKPQKAKQQNEQPKKPCPQKTMIEYPPIIKPKPIKKIAPVDLIPKRKNQLEIQKELDNMKKNPYIPENKGQNRISLIEKLQEKFKKGRGALPKGAELPKAEFEEGDEINEEEIKKRALTKLNKKNMYVKQEGKPEGNKYPTTKEEEYAELDLLYNEIEKEIEDRQQYLEEIDNLDEPELKAKIKKEIIERVSELQKVIKMMNT